MPHLEHTHPAAGHIPPNFGFEADAAGKSFGKRDFTFGIYGFRLGINFFEGVAVEHGRQPLHIQAPELPEFLASV